MTVAPYLVEQLQELGNRGDLVALGLNMANWPQHSPLAAAQALTVSMAALPCARSTERRSVLPSMAIGPPFDEAAKALTEER